MFFVHQKAKSTALVPSSSSSYAGVRKKINKITVLTLRCHFWGLWREHFYNIVKSQVYNIILYFSLFMISHIFMCVYIYVYTLSRVIPLVSESCLPPRTRTLITAAKSPKHIRRQKRHAQGDFFFFITNRADTNSICYLFIYFLQTIFFYVPFYICSSLKYFQYTIFGIRNFDFSTTIYQLIYYGRLHVSVFRVRWTFPE